MDAFDTLHISGVSAASSVAYDPQTRTHIVAGEGVLFQPERGLGRAFLAPKRPREESPDEKKIQAVSNEKESSPPLCLRFVPNAKSQALTLSPSGIDRGSRDRTDGGVEAVDEGRRYGPPLHELRLFGGGPLLGAHLSIELHGIVYSSRH